MRCVERQREPPQGCSPGNNRHREVDEGLDGLDEPEVDELLPRRPIPERCDELLQEAVAAWGPPDRRIDVDAEEGTDAAPLDGRSAAPEQEREGEDRQSDQRDQHASARRDQGREDREPEHAERKVEQQVERREVRPALDQRCEEAKHAPNVDPRSHHRPAGRPASPGSCYHEPSERERPQCGALGGFDARSALRGSRGRTPGRAAERQLSYSPCSSRSPCRCSRSPSVPSARRTWRTLARPRTR
jgi:hypothetical protein